MVVVVAVALVLLIFACLVVVVFACVVDVVDVDDHRRGDGGVACEEGVFAPY